jgi:hypothetical protein
MAGSRLTREVLRSHAKPEGALKRGTKTDERLKATVLLDSTSNDGVFDKWSHRFGQRDIGLHIDEHLGLQAGTSVIYDSPDLSDIIIEL